MSTLIFYDVFGLEARIPDCLRHQDSRFEIEANGVIPCRDLNGAEKCEISIHDPFDGAVTDASAFPLPRRLKAAGFSMNHDLSRVKDAFRPKHSGV
jgi:hypothetical protein